jgi:hypothetical protein
MMAMQLASIRKEDMGKIKKFICQDLDTTNKLFDHTMTVLKQLTGFHSSKYQRDEHVIEALYSSFLVSDLNENLS